nr:hypothetical protein [Tanacetum cinerariifolium]
HAQPEDTHELLCTLLEDLQLINEELAEYINSPSWNRPAFYDDDDDEYYIQVSEKAPIVIAPVLPTEEPDNSISMGDEHLDTILKTKSDEVIKSIIEDLVPIPSESEGILDNMTRVSIKTPIIIFRKLHQVFNNNTFVVRIVGDRMRLFSVNQ